MKNPYLKYTALALLFSGFISFTSCKDNNAGSDADTDPNAELLDKDDTSPIDTVRTADGDTIIDTEGTHRLDEPAADDQTP